MNIELPKDAEGRKIPLDTEVLYDKDGHPNDVSYFTYAPRSYSSGWSVVLVGGFERFASAMHLTPPDSWEKLEEDLDMCVAENTACMYFSKDGTCRNCAIRNTSDGCAPKVLKDIVSRIRKLRGED